MLFQQPDTSTLADDPRGLIDRVLKLRRELGINIPLSISDSEDSPPTYNSQDWLSWSQSPSPGDGKPPED